MKLRLQENSIRLRLNRSEVRELAAGGTLTEQVHFPGPAAVEYVLQSVSRAGVEASFHEGTIRVLAPASEIKDWANGESIGLYFEVPARLGPLRIAIEKDLECVDRPPEERDIDAFPRLVGKNC